ncbi:hypothetical protein [Polaribacter sp. Z022]|uniref:hypothetical protein n=1 Tax=Polaribacter sp. Z022 TaxID=2927125 RepID=UPI0020200602|nr:hypothetical protein [Polaribacter sp. Z022]MCL7754447.1 hypothetical protein [Polaribacter sp. Z022]
MNKNFYYPEEFNQKNVFLNTYNPLCIIKMNLLKKIIFLFLINFSCFSQKDKNGKLDFKFLDKCTNKFVEAEFETDSIPGLKNGVSVTYYTKRGNWISQGFYSTIINENSIDTIIIPKILFSFGNELHSKRWKYLNCEKPCNGIETDFYENGKKRIVGNFENGKPLEIKEYRENGTLVIQTFYENLTLKYNRINYYDHKERLVEYEIYENKRKKTIVKTFSKDGKLIRKETEKHNIEKNKWN